MDKFKKYITLNFLIILLTPCLSQAQTEYKYPELVSFDIALRGKLIEKDLPNGIYTAHYDFDISKIAFIVTYKGGLPNGSCTYFWERGKKKGN